MTASEDTVSPDLNRAGTLLLTDLWIKVFSLVSGWQEIQAVDLDRMFRLSDQPMNGGSYSILRRITRRHSIQVRVCHFSQTQLSSSSCKRKPVLPALWCPRLEDVRQRVRTDIRGRRRRHIRTRTRSSLPGLAARTHNSDTVKSQRET